MDFTIVEPSQSGVENALFITDVLSKYSLAIPTHDQSASTVAKVLVWECFYKFKFILIRVDVFWLLSSNNFASLMGLKDYAPRPTFHLEMANVNTVITHYITSSVLCLYLKKGIGLHVFPSYSFVIALPHIQRLVNRNYFWTCGQDPRLPIDFLLSIVQKPIACAVHDWVGEHQTRLQTAFNEARGRLQACSK